MMKKFRQFISKVLWEYKLYRMDRAYYDGFPGAITERWGYPPSFYIRYTPEEQEQKKKEYIQELRAIIDSFDEK